MAIETAFGTPVLKSEMPIRYVALGVIAGGKAMRIEVGL
jgi:hypothetical protein